MDFVAAPAKKTLARFFSTLWRFSSRATPYEAADENSQIFFCQNFSAANVPMAHKCALRQSTKPGPRRPLTHDASVQNTPTRPNWRLGGPAA